MTAINSYRTFPVINYNFLREYTNYKVNYLVLVKLDRSCIVHRVTVSLILTQMKILHQRSI